MASTASLKFSPLRALGVLGCIALAFAVLLGRVTYLQTIGRQQTIARADRQHHQREPLRARRGSIYDRNGIEMAGTVQTQAVFVDPKFMRECFEQDGQGLVEMDKSVARLANAVNRDAYEISQLLSDRFEARFVKVAEHVDDVTCARVMRLDLPGVGIAPSDVRYYPMGSLAAHVLGGAGSDGRGLEGLELRFQKLLSGKAGYVRQRKDAAHRPIGVAAEDYLPAQHGQHLTLTIDANIQMIAEQELAATCRQFHARTGEVVVMDPDTGEVLALANYPTFNPQYLQDTQAQPEIRRNAALICPYEPGSTIKPFVFGPALASGVTRFDEVWKLGGARYRTSYGRTITDVHGYPELATWDGLVKSSNIVMARIAGRMGNPRLHRALTSWGFGQRTGIELPGEDPGHLFPLRKWTKYSTESIAQGYELRVTPLQLCRAFAAYANGGYLVQPTILQGTLDADGALRPRRDPADVQPLPRVLDRETSLHVRRVLADVVVRGTAKGARSDTWNLFGKTGTAHISEGKAGYSPDRYTSSFLCGAPVENPRLVAAFIVHEPDKKWAAENNLTHYGGAVAAPGAMRMLERSLAYLGVPASPELAPPPAHIAAHLHQYNANLYKRKPAKAATANVR